jgi:hypothetical protein
MLISFDNMPSYARIWVYQADRSLTSSEVLAIEQYLSNQVADWAAHGAPLAGSFQVLHQRFVIVAVDEKQNAASGCSIDASTRWLKDLGQNLAINFFDRSIAYWHNNSIQTVEMLKIKPLVAEGVITPDTIIFNNLVANIDDFQAKWQVKAGDSWMARYFKTATA